MPTLDAVPTGDDIAVSATLFMTWRRCPQQALARLRGIYPPPSRAAFKGALVHRLISRHLEDGPIDRAEFEEVCRRETGANLNVQPGQAGLTPSGFRAVVAEAAELYERFTALPIDQVTATEVSFEVEAARGITLRGRIDAVFEGADGSRIVDWKTGRDLGEEVDAQLGFYALAWKLDRGDLPAGIDAVSISTGERRVADPSREAIDAVEEEVGTMVAELRQALAADRDIARTAGPHCRWCPILDGCAEGSSALELLD